jgi:hypothetical protein
MLDRPAHAGERIRRARMRTEPAWNGEHIDASAVCVRVRGPTAAAEGLVDPPPASRRDTDVAGDGRGDPARGLARCMIVCLV